MANPRIILQGSAKETSKWVGLARKLANQTEKAGLLRKTLDLGKAILRVEHFGSGISRVIIRGGQQDEETRDQIITQCGVWTNSSSGGFGTTIDIWDISKMPAGSTFDILFDAFDQPDKFVGVYDGVTVLDTGWRGSPIFNGDPEFPEGVISPGRGQIDRFFIRRASEILKITVYGPLEGTLWAYALRATCPS